MNLSGDASCFNLNRDAKKISWIIDSGKKIRSRRRINIKKEERISCLKYIITLNLLYVSERVEERVRVFYLSFRNIARRMQSILNTTD